MSDSKYSKIRPKLSRYVILRYAKPDPPLIYNRKNNDALKAKSYKVLDILKYCDGSNSIEDISQKTDIDAGKIYFLLLKLERLRWLHFEE